MTTNQRKLDHIDSVLNWNVDDNFHCFDSYDLPYRALPELDLEHVDTSINFFWKELSFPFIISSMTWWPVKWSSINKNLAEAAERAWIWLWLWSMRIIIEDPSTIDTFNIRKLCPSIPLFANVWVVQFNYWFGADECNRLIDAIQADWIFLHVNPLQEAVQPEWDTNFSWLIDKIATIIPKLNAPVIIKETWNWIDWVTAKKLKEAWVQRIDVSWRWWVSRPAVEWERRWDSLWDSIRWLWITTDQTLLQCRAIEWLNLIAWWWVRSWVDWAKALALWASLFTAWWPFLKPSLESADAVYEELELRKKQMQIALFSTGSGNIEEFKNNIQL